MFSTLLLVYSIGPVDVRTYNQLPKRLRSLYLCSTSELSNTSACNIVLAVLHHNVNRRTLIELKMLFAVVLHVCLVT